MRRATWRLIGAVYGFAITVLVILSCGFAALSIGTWYFSIRPFAKHPVMKVAPETSMAAAITGGIAAYALFLAGA